MASVAKGALIFMMLGALTACGPSQEEQVANAEKAKAAQVAFQHELDVVRQARLAELTKPDGWTSLVGLHWIDPGSHYIGSSAGNGIKLAVGPEHLGMIDLAPGRVRFVPDKGAALTLDGQPFTAEAILRADDAPTGPSVIGFDDGKGLATVIKRADRYLLRVKHADAPTRTGFRGIEYWPTAADWRVEGRFVPHEAGKTLEIANIIGTTDAVPNPGAIEFERDGKIVKVDPPAPLIVRIGGAVDLAVDAAIAGTGIVGLFDAWLRPHFESGALEPVLEPWWQSFSGPFLYYPGRRLVPAPLRAFIDFIKSGKS